jgi:hypothetical protein
MDRALQQYMTPEQFMAFACKKRVICRQMLWKRRKTVLFRCFLYKEGRDFQLPPAFKRVRHYPSFLTVTDADGVLHPYPGAFVEEDDPKKAELFLFPLDIGAAIDCNLQSDIENIIAALPYMPGRAERHLVSDMADRAQSVSLGVCLFKVSVTRDSGQQERLVVMGYPTPRHVLGAKPDFTFGNICYDSSFVGTYNHISRRACIASIQHEAPELRVFIKIHNTFAVHGDHFYTKHYRGEEREKWLSTFIRSLQRSISVLCPPGVGPQSVRMYEAMCMGRIPVLFDYNALYPLSEEIDFSAFSLIIPGEDVMHTGNILQEWLGKHSEREILDKWLLARKTWLRYFSPDAWVCALLRQAEKKFAW